MANYNQAPRLVHLGQKELIVDGKREGFIGIPNDIFMIACKELSSYNTQLRLLLLLIGTGEDWGVSEKWVEQMTGLPKGSYHSARKGLVARGWLDVSEKGKIKVDYDAIRGIKKEEPGAVEEMPSEDLLTAFDF